jgi:hypothetical protein
MMNRIQSYVLGLVGVLILAGCASSHHAGMAGGGTSDAYWEKGQQDMASLIDRTVKDQGKGQQVKSIVNDIVAELKTRREQERALHRRLYELNANYEATPEEFARTLDEADDLRVQSVTKILSLRFKMRDLMTVEEWKALSDQMLAYSNRYKHSGEGEAKTGY